MGAIDERESIVVALDLDGVVNSANWLKHRATESGRRLRDGFVAEYDRRTAIELANIDPECGRLVSDLVSKTGAYLIISSTWREGREPAHFEWLFKTAGCPLPRGSVIGCTPVLDHLSSNKRGHEIDAWVKANAFGGRLIILDDDSEGFLDCQSLFTTDYQTGLTEENVKAILEYLAAS